MAAKNTLLPHNKNCVATLLRGASIAAPCTCGVIARNAELTTCENCKKFQQLERPLHKKESRAGYCAVESLYIQDYRYVPDGCPCEWAPNPLKIEDRRK